MFFWYFNEQPKSYHWSPLTSKLMSPTESPDRERSTGSPTASDSALPYQQTGTISRETKQFLGWFAVILLALTAIAVVPTVVGLVDSAILGMLTPVLSWAPTLILVGLHRRHNRGDSFLETAAIKPNGAGGRIVAVSLSLFVGLSGLAILTEALAVVFGLKSISISPDAWSLLPLVPILIGFTMLTTAGEEFAWRGFIQTKLAPLGFWRASAAIGAFWSLWHIPLAIGYVMSGEMLVRELLSTSGNLFLAAFVLSGVRYLSGSVWPAVFGHALLNTVLVYVYSNFTTTIGATAGVTFWTYTALSWLVWLGLIAVVVQLLPKGEPTTSTFT